MGNKRKPNKKSSVEQGTYQKTEQPFVKRCITQIDNTEDLQKLKKLLDQKKRK
jgi:hypothetical protein